MLGKLGTDINLDVFKHYYDMFWELHVGHKNTISVNYWESTSGLTLPLYIENTLDCLLVIPHSYNFTPTPTKQYAYHKKYVLPNYAINWVTTYAQPHVVLINALSPYNVERLDSCTSWFQSSTTCHASCKITCTPWILSSKFCLAYSLLGLMIIYKHIQLIMCTHTCLFNNVES